jgi:hypothetical protein
MFDLLNNAVAIQSYWHRDKFPINRTTAEYAALSANLLLKHFKHVVFAGDSVSVQAFEHIPYTSKCVIPEQVIGSWPEHFWSISKYWAILHYVNLNHEAFYHIDHDLFFNQDFYEYSRLDVPWAVYMDEKRLTGSTHYNQVLEPHPFNYKDNYFFNFGIFGGTSVSALRSAVRRIYDWSITNYKRVDKLEPVYKIRFNRSVAAPLLEQVYTPCYINTEFGLDPSPFLHVDKSLAYGEENRSIITAEEDRLRVRHLYGYFRKHDYSIYVSTRLQAEFPETFDKIARQFCCKHA